MRTLILILFAIITIGHTGCDRDSRDEETPSTVVEVLSEEDKAILPEKLSSLDYLLSRPLKERKTRSKKYMLKYLELKDRDPKEALEALRKGLYIHAKGDHPLLEEWVALTHKIASKGEGTLLEILRGAEIELQIARDHDESPKDIKALEEQVEQAELQRDKLKEQGIDPQEFKIPIKFEVDPDEE